MISGETASPLFLFFPPNLYEWSTDSSRDLAENGNFYATGPYIFTGSQQGNFNSAYAFTREFGYMAGTAISIAGEVTEVGRVVVGDISIWTAIKNAYGSYTMNMMGIFYGMRDRFCGENP